jgi:hypothetical protein
MRTAEECLAKSVEMDDAALMCGLVMAEDYRRMAEHWRRLAKRAEWQDAWQGGDLL